MKQSLNALYLAENIEVVKKAKIETKGCHKIWFPENFPALEKKILTTYFQGGKTIRKISKILNISGERVKQLIKKELRRFKINKELARSL